MNCKKCKIDCNQCRNDRFSVKLVIPDPLYFPPIKKTVNLRKGSFFSGVQRQSICEGMEIELLLPRFFFEVN